MLQYPNGAGVFQVNREDGNAYLYFAYLYYLNTWHPIGFELIAVHSNPFGNIQLQPSIAMTPGSPYDIYHVVWQANRYVYYRMRNNNGDWSDLEEVANLPYDTCYPFAEAYGDSVYIAWVQPNQDNTDIFRRARNVEDGVWGNAENISLSGGGNAYSRWPVESRRAFVVWAEEPPANWEIFYRAQLDPYEPPLPIGNLSGSADFSLYPHSDCYSYQNYSKSEIPVTTVLTSIWTEGNESPFTIMEASRSWQSGQFHLNADSRDSLCINPIFYYVETGNPDPSPYCLKRDGFVERIADYGDTLSYQLPYLDPSKYYFLRAIFFSSGKDLEIEHKISVTIEGIIDTIITFQTKSSDTLYIALPEKSYDDTQTYILMTSLTRNDVYLSDLTIYLLDAVEGAYMKGGPMASEPEKPFYVTSLNIYPNLIKGVARVRYEISEKGPVSLKIYDATGRLVKILTKAQNLEPKAYTVNWNGIDEEGKKLSCGIYFIRLDTKNRSLTKKVVILN